MQQMQTIRNEFSVTSVRFSASAFHIQATVRRASFRNYGNVKVPMIVTSHLTHCSLLHLGISDFPLLSWSQKQDYVKLSGSFVARMTRGAEAV